MLFDNLYKHELKDALITEKGERIKYGELLAKIKQVKLGEARKLVFIYVENNVSSIIAYIACIQSNHPVLLLNPDSREQNQDITDLYQPNIIINCVNDQLMIENVHDKFIDMHPELSVLLSTSGSTGSPKLVKLSKSNISANTDAICQYLELTDSDRAITTLKFNYSYGLSIINAHLNVGGSIFLTDISITDKSFWAYFFKYNITSFSGVPYSYELLRRQEIDFSSFQSLRYLTQAGGRLAPELVKHFSQQGSNGKFDFFVMYGQTEASPRISYLPAKYIHEYSDCIGMAIPNGELQIVDVNNNQISSTKQQGELRYKGPNVMMGYAYHTKDLATKESIEWLYTGDIAVKNAQGLFKLVGRVSRFVKPYGVRISLDDIQADLSAQNMLVGVTSVEEHIVIAIESVMNNFSKAEITAILSEKYKIPESSFQVYLVEGIPTLSNGKINYHAIKNLTTTDLTSETRGLRTFFKLFAEEFLTAIGNKKHTWSNLIELFIFYFPNEKIGFDSTFSSLSGDSLQYVSVSLEIESYLGLLPAQWHIKSIEELEGMRK